VSRLIDKPLKYASNQFRNGSKPGDLVTLGSREIQPQGKMPFTGPVVGLIGPGCVSSGEGFALMLKALPQGTLIGQPTRGASGNPQPVLLPNGNKVHYSTWVPLQLDGKPFEGIGIVPDQKVDDDPTGVKGLEAAVAELGKRGR
jgi:C-terminal processing protease CtpA/Prc